MGSCPGGSQTSFGKVLKGFVKKNISFVGGMVWGLGAPGAPGAKLQVVQKEL